MTRPTAKQQSDLDQIQGEVALVHFLPIRHETSLEGYIGDSALAASANDGRRRYQCRVDQILAGGNMAYDTLLVNTFPSGEAALKAFTAGRDAQDAAGAYILAVSRQRPATSHQPPATSNHKYRLANSSP